ncbi:cell division protein ZipA [Halomonas alkaliantarctica]|nr:cell division protein ZipA [Halomonas alkaliantarctica]
MELREWLIVLGLALVSLIVIDGVRRLQRQRRVPRLDQAAEGDLGGEKKSASDTDPEEAQRQAELNWELPNGGARVVKPADYSGLNGKPKLERQEHPGPSRVLSEFRRSKSQDETPSDTDAKAPEVGTATAEPPRHTEPTLSVPPVDATNEPKAHKARHEAREAPAAHAESGEAVEIPPAATTDTSEPPTLRAIRADEDDIKAHAGKSDTPRRQLRPDIAGEREEASHNDEQYEDDSYRLVDFDGIKHSFIERMAERRKAKQLKKEEKARRAKALAQQKAERKAQKERQRLEAQAAHDAEKARLVAEQASAQEAAAAKTAEAMNEPPIRAQSQEDQRYAAYSAGEDENGHRDDAEPAFDNGFDDTVRPHPTLEKALRHDVCGGHARKTLSNAEEVIVISVMSRSEEGFDGSTLLELLMACGLRYSRGMGIFHRFETESPDSELQFSMVNVVKPGSFPIEDMDEFVTPGVTFLMPLPGAEDSSAAFEAMVETAMVVVRHLGGELKDENHSVMTAQTIEFARQRVHEFERRHRLHQQMQAH